MKSFLLALALFGASVASAGTLVVRDAYSYPTAAPGVPAAGFLTLDNQGAKADRLVAAESASFSRIEIHEMTEQDGVMRMRALPKGLPLPAKQSATLAPGGTHLMLFGPKAPLREGEKLPVTLRFERAAPVEVDLEVRPRTPPAPEAPTAHQHSH